jgi:hypothetical protein
MTTDNGPSENAVRRAMRQLADEYNELDPAHHYTVHDPEHPKPGAHVVWASTPPTRSAGEPGQPGPRRASSRRAGTDRGSARE